MMNTSKPIEFDRIKVMEERIRAEERERACKILDKIEVEYEQRVISWSEWKGIRQKILNSN